MDEIIDRIYEASIIPDLWIDVLDRLAAIAHCDGGILVAADSHQNIRALSSERLAPMLSAFINEGWMRQNIRASRLRSMNYSGFVVDLDIVTPKEAETDPFYVNCLRKYGGGVGTGTVIPAPSGDLIIFNIERSYQRGFVDREVLPALDAIRPHLARSALLSVRLGLQRAQTMTETLGRLDLPGAVFSTAGRVLSANNLLENLDEQFVATAGGGIAISHPPANALLQLAIKGPSHRDYLQTSSIPVPATEKCRPCVAHLIPIRRGARDIFTQAAYIFVVTPIGSPQAPEAHILLGLFDLSPAEARVAQKLVEGANVEKIALDQKLSRETIRGQLKAIFAKTGTNRQSDLVSLLLGAQIRSHK